jgi:molecular chaperone GrpE
VLVEPPRAEPAVDTTVEPEPDMVGSDLEVLTEDLQRLSAEYANYRRRVERDRAAVRDAAVSGVIAELLPVLDDIGRAREHGELDGAFRAVGEALEQTVTKLGVERYAEAGEPFDPTVHEALTAVPSPGVEEPTVLEVYAPGYRYAGRIVRPARVVVAQPVVEDEPPVAAHP